MAGNYIADLINKREQDSLVVQLRNGVEMHQWIDIYTDSHQNIRRFNKYFHPVIHHYAPVATDVIMDYFLFQNWDEYMNISYLDFSFIAYQSLHSNEIFFPEKPRALMRRMIEGDWLQQYKTLEGIHYVMNRLNQRTRFKVDFTTTIPVVKDNEFEMNKLFVDFFQDAMKGADEWKQRNGY